MSAKAWIISVLFAAMFVPSAHADVGMVWTDFETNHFTGYERYYRLRKTCEVDLPAVIQERLARISSNHPGVDTSEIRLTPRLDDQSIDYGQRLLTCNVVVEAESNQVKAVVWTKDFGKKEGAQAQALYSENTIYNVNKMVVASKIEKIGKKFRVSVLELRLR